MQIEVPDKLVEPWGTYDAAYEALRVSAARDGGISRAGLSAFFSAIAGKSPWQNASFALWAYIRHGAANYGDFQQTLVDYRTDTFGDKNIPRPHLVMDRTTKSQSEAQQSGEERLLYRMNEAAAALGISRSKLYELASGGLIPTVRIGHSLRVPVAALREYISRHTNAESKSA